MMFFSGYRFMRIWVKKQPAYHVNSPELKLRAENSQLIKSG